MTEERKKERMSRIQAAERLVDIAYALTVGCPLELKVEGERIRVPIADQLLFERVSRSNGDRVELELELSWSTETADAWTRDAPRADRVGTAAYPATRPPGPSESRPREAG